MFDFTFNTTSAFVINFFYIVFPILLAVMYLFFSYLVYRSEKETSPRKIALIFILIALFLVSSVFDSGSLWISAVGAGLLLILSTQLIDLLLLNLKNQVAIRSARFVLILLTSLVLLTQLVTNILNVDWAASGEVGLLNFWSGVLFFVSFFLIFFKSKNLKINPNISTIDFYNPVSLFSFLPIGILLIVNINQNFSRWVFIPLLFGLLWFAVYFISFQKGQILLKLREIKGLKLSISISSVVGLLIYVLLFYQKTDLFSDIQIAKIMSLYVFGFSLVFYAYLYIFDTKSRTQLNTAEYKKIVPSKFKSIEDVITGLHKSISNQISPAYYLHFSLDPINQIYRPQRIADTPDSNLTFSLESNLVQTLNNKDEPLFFDNGKSFEEDLVEEKEMLELLAADSIVPIKAEGKLLGWISLSFEEKDLGSIHLKTNKILPIVYEYAYQLKKMDDQMKLELREKNFNVLSRIVQGVNYTLTLDDIYELIFAQTSQVVPSNAFFIVLKEENSQKLRSVFHIELDERIHEKENQFILISNSVEAFVTKSGRGVIANNYPEFCHLKKLDSYRENIQNALVAPLNTGDKTIGCIFLANRNIEDMFSNDQFDLLISIADLVAGAIEKARLLDQTQQYAHQLSALNDLLRKLSSVINIDILLKSFLDLTNELIEFEESRLITFDENSELLLYQEVKGQKSLAFKNEKVNSVFKLFDEISISRNILVFDQNFFPDDTIYAFYKKQDILLQSLMIIPLIIKDRVIGFIELINRIDQHIFSENDKQLMQAFAAQASIAWENARLYHQTDQELAERVEELSIMQKIDRDLNTSLDIHTTLEITLSWVMKWLKAGAGWIGLIKDEAVTDIKYAGFEINGSTALPETISFSRIESLKVDHDLSARKLSPNEFEKFHALTQELIFSPIYREEQLVAVIIMEFFNEVQFTINEKKFLERMSDHASIALMNSLFYEEIQKANFAKSEFVSLVAHELKNPMTSIKGYTELLTTGAAGKISETQANFLSIIQNNTDRMNALVSDLNDLTKIETGIIHLESKATQVEDIINIVIASIRKQIDQKNQILTVNILNEIPPMQVDPIRLTQILINLLSNANKYTEEFGKISLFAEKTKAPDEIGKNDNVAHIWVEDSGIGISAEDQKLIFQKFFRSEDQNVRAVTGTGLGLNITRSLIELMGGSIWFESEIGKGTTFHIVVPLFDD